jgi:hypothetical protein
MIVSVDEVVRLLRKWHSEDIPVSVLMRAPGLSASLVGFISSVEKSQFSVGHLTPEAKRLGLFALEFASVTSFEYRDVREAAERAQLNMGGRFGSALVFTTENARCMLYEIIEREGNREP